MSYLLLPVYFYACISCRIYVYCYGWFVCGTDPPKSHHTRIQLCREMQACVNTDVSNVSVRLKQPSPCFRASVGALEAQEGTGFLVDGARRP